MIKKRMHNVINQGVLLGCFFSLLMLINCLEIQPIDQPEEVVDDDGAVISKPFIWEKDVTDEGWIWAELTPVFHKNSVVLPGAPADGKGMLVALDLETGEEIWRWNDYVDGYDFAEVLSREQLNRKDNIVIFNNHYRFCAVDLDNGTTLWKDKRDGSSPSTSIQILGDHYYFPFDLTRNGVNVATLMRGSIYSSAYEKIVEVPMDTIQLFFTWYGSFYDPHVYSDENENIHAFMPFSENLDLFKGQNFNSYVSYNVSTGTCDFEKVRIPDTASLGTSGRPVLIGEMMILNSGESIYGINKHTGEIVWSRKDFDTGYGDGSFITAKYKDRFFAVNRIGSIDRVMELDPFTGNTKWIDEGRGGSTHPSLYFLNDVLYFISRGDERMYAYDINGGKLLWKLQSPDYAGFVTMQTLKGATAEDKGLLVACSWLNAYRFEPAR